MSDEAAFLAAIRAAPDDNTTRLVYADWLAESGRAEAAFLRAEHELAALPLGNLRWHRGFAGLRQAAAGLPPEWCQAARRYPPSHWLAAAARSAWTRIEAVLRATAPDLLAALPAGASPEAIAAAERRLGVELPADVRESYAVHDGSGGVDHGAGIIPTEYYGFMGVALHSLDEMVREWQMWQEWRGGQPVEPRSSFLPLEGPVKAERSNPRWVPVTWDGGGCNLGIDLDPAPGGVPGQVIFLDHLNSMCVVAEGWWALLERLAAGLEAGRLRFEAGELVAADAEAGYTAALESLIADLKHAEPLSWPTDLSNNEAPGPG
ncbi:TIGR02996 domain-containing protein [Gemmata sp.]|uniref:TIGR02996 domain-containing protein n=1 Tax=Gemmata sp. TaxID=1914242 RepID=UPI003F7086EE